jgi:hypothetical protein
MRRGAGCEKPHSTHGLRRPSGRLEIMTRKRRRELRKKRTSPGKPRATRTAKMKEQEGRNQRYVNYLAEEHLEF